MIAALLRWLFGSGPVPATLPKGQRIYAVGDVHGRADLLGRLAGLIEADLGGAMPGCAASIVMLGDYVDRGPGSAAVIERLASGDMPAPVVALRGNHDDLFLRLLAGDFDLDDFRHMGGEATLASYGLDLDKLERRRPAEQVARLTEAVPPHHRSFLAETAFSHAAGGYFFCHAGVRPGIPLAAQDPQDLLWIRKEFLHSDADFGRVVVHGHTPSRTPQIRRNRICLDTKAFASGTLTALVLEEAERRFLQT